MEKLNKGRKPPGYNKRSEEQRIYDVRFCADLFLRGYSYREIADALNRDLSARGVGYTISFQMVYYDLQQCLIEWKQRTKEKTNRGRHIKTDATDGDPEYYGYDETTVETSAGNPRFLDLLLNIQQRRAKMLGFDAPVKIEIPGYNAGTDDDKPKYDVKAIPDDLLFAVADKLQSAEFQKTIAEKGGAQ